MPTAFPKFFGPILIVRDLEASVAFYRDVIRLQGEPAGPYAEFSSGPSTLVLLDEAFWKSAGGLAAPAPRSSKREGVVLAIQVEDADHEHDRIKSIGVVIASPPTDRPMMGLRNFQLHDPDGNLVEITSSLRRSPPPAKPRTITSQVSER